MAGPLASAALAAVGLGTWTWEPSRDRLTLSRRMAALFGLPAGAPFTRGDLVARLHPDDRDRVLGAWARAVEAGGEHRFEYRVVRPNGELRWLESWGQLVRGENGAPPRLVGLAVDVTDRKRTEAALRESEARYRLLFERHPSPLWVFDLDTLRFLAVNDAALARYGYERDEFLGLTLLDVRPPAEVPNLLAKVERVRQQPLAHDLAGVWRHRAKDGTDFEVEVTTHALTWQGRPARLGMAVDVSERRRAELALRESEARFRQLTETLDAVFWLIDPRDRRIIYVSPAYQRIWGLDPDRLYADFRVWREIVHPDDWERSERVFVEAGSTGRYDQEYRIVLPSGEVRWIRDRGFPVESETGEVERIAGIAEDITERKQAEAALAEREARLRLATEAAHLGTWDIDPTTGTASASGWLREALGVPPDRGDAPLAEWLRWFDPDDRARTEAELARAVREDAPFAVEVRVQPPGGEPRLIASSGTVERDAGGQAVRIFGIAADVTEARRSEAALRASEERFRATFEQAAVGMAELDLDGHWLRVNQKLCDIVGYDREELLGRTWQEISHGPDLEEDLALVRRLVAGEIGSFSFEKRYRRKDGSLVWVQVTPTVVQPPEGPAYFVTVIEDISGRKQADRARQRAQAAMRRQASLLDQAYDAILAWEWDGTIAYWNRGAERLYGYTAQEAVGRVSHDLLRSKHRATVEQVMAILDRDGVWEGEVEHLRRDGRSVLVESRHVVVREGHRRTVLEVNRDVTGRRAAEAEREGLLARLEAERGRLAAVLDQMPSGVIIAEAPSGRLLSANPQVERIWGRPFFAAAAVDEYRAYPGLHPDGRPLQPEEWPLARAITAGETVTGEEIEILRGDGSRATLSLNAAPIRDRDGTIVAGVVTFDDVTERNRAAAGQRFLAQASAELASSLDYELTLARVARLAVPELADLCVIDVPHEDGTFRRLAVAHADPAKEGLIRAAEQRHPTRLDSPAGPPRVLRTGQPEVVPELEDALLAALAQDAEHLAAMRALGLGSYLSVPMTARGRTLGVLTFGAEAGTGRFCSKDDLPLAEEIARRAAVAIDNARLYAAELRARQAAQRATERIARLQRVTAALAEALTPDEIAAAVVDQGLAALGADAGSLALVTAGDELEVVRAEGYPAAVLDVWRRFPITAAVPLAEAVLTRRVVVIQAPEELAERFPALAETPGQPEHQTLVAVPLLVDERSIGGIGLSFAARQPFGADDQAYALALARQAAQALERARLYEAERAAREQAEAARARLTFLAEASALLSGSLGVETTLRQVADLVVPKLADWCTIHLLTEAGEVVQLTVAHADPTKVAWARALQERYPADPTANQGVFRVLRTGQPELYPTIDDATLAAAARDDEHLALLRQAGMASAMILPLAAHGETLGALSLIAAESGRRYGPDDLAFAEDLARRCAVAVANARLFAAQRRARGAAEAAERAARRDAGRLATLARSSAAFAAATLDYEAALDAVARFTAELTGDACVVRLVSEDGEWADAAAVHHPDSTRLLAVRGIVGSRRQRVDEGFSASVLRTGAALLVPAVDQDQLRATIPSEAWPLLDQVPVRSLLVVPLRARDRVIGTLALLRDRADQRFDDEDRAFLQEVADRAGLAIANARLYRQAQEAVRARDEFLSIAAHELRTPVTTVKGYAQMLARASNRDQAGSERAGRFLRAIDAAADRLGVLTNDLLDVSRIRLGQLPLRPQPLDLAELAHGLVDRYADQVDPAHRVSFAVHGEPPTVVADPDRTEQILTNLLDNAAKYSPAGGEIAVTVEPGEGGDGVLLSVRDEGIGLPPGEAEVIFEPFNRASNAARDNLPGMGLGLHICRSIAERHGGRIWAESPGEGQGTTMYLWLPSRQSPVVSGQESGVGSQTAAVDA